MLAALLLAQALHGGLSLGVGTAYDGAGARLEMDVGHFGVFAGYGLFAAAFTDSTLSAPGTFGFSAGARWYSGERRGAFISVNFTDVLFRNWANYDVRGPGSPTLRGSFSTLSAVAGFRWRLQEVFVELGVGAGAYRDREPGSSFGSGVVEERSPGYGPMPDVVLGVGFDL